jgi:hypothetical protein
MRQQEIDLELHLLYTAFKNKFITPEDPTTTQQLVSRLMTEYPHIFQTSLKISYAISTLKNEGLIYEEQRIDKAAYEKCLEEMREKHKRMSEDNITRKCLKRLGYKSILMPTELGIIEYCSRVSKYIKDRATKTNIIILDTCKTYSQGEQP